MEIERTCKEIIDQNQYIAGYIISTDGRIAYVNDTYLKILNMGRSEVLGRPIIEVSPHTRTLTVLKTGKAIVGYNWKVNGRDMIASAIPIFDEDTVKGVFAYSVFLDINDAREMVENLMAELKMYRNEVNTMHQARYRLDDLAGDSPAFSRLKNLIRQIARHPDTTVLITGESGTGKELAANSIHNLSIRAHNAFIRVNCAAIPEHLLEAELFGYEDGAFTGARKGGKPGKLELAQGGTVFLDEIGEMSLSMQSKLLVVLQEREIERVGGSHPIRLDVRIIAATNRNIEQMVEEGGFRQDLYFRLNVFQLGMPPLRERRADIPLLVSRLMNQYNCRLRFNISGISRKAVENLQNYPWPGNVRELSNVLERAMIMAGIDGSTMLNRSHFSFLNDAFDVPLRINRITELKTITDAVERQVIVRALQESGRDREAAARLLGVHRTTLSRKMKKHGLPLKD